MSTAEFGENLQRVALLKALEENTKKSFITDVLEKESDADLRKKISAVVLESNMAGIAEFSDEWFFLIKKKMYRMQLMRDSTLKCLQALGEASGFDAFERCLIMGCCHISSHYDNYYLAYLKAVQEQQIVQQLKNFPPDVNDQAVHCSYTIVLWNKDKGAEQYLLVLLLTYLRGTIVLAFEKISQHCGNRGKIRNEYPEWCVNLSISVLAKHADMGLHGR